MNALRRPLPERLCEGDSDRAAVARLGGGSDGFCKAGDIEMKKKINKKNCVHLHVFTPTPTTNPHSVI